MAAKAHEIFSLTNELTRMTNRWYSTAQHQRATGQTSYSTQIKGQFLSRVVNLLIFPTDLIDGVAHIAMGTLTLLALAPGEAACNLCKKKEDRSNHFTLIGGLRNFGYAAKHLLESIFRAVIGIFNPFMAYKDFQTVAQEQARYQKTIEYYINTSDNNTVNLGDSSDEEEYLVNEVEIKTR